MTPTPRARGFFITGTDTGVGKTVVSCGLVRALRESGLDVGAMKPIETGVDASGPQDAIALREAAGDRDPLEVVCPLQFELPAAPNVAAAYEDRTIALDVVDRAFETIASGRDAIVVEGAGGLLVPIDAKTTMADLATRLGLPVLIVARAALGTINHTLLTLEAARARSLEVVGVAISHAGGELSMADAHNLQHLRDVLGEQIVAEIPPLAGEGAAAASQFNLNVFTKRLG